MAFFAPILPLAVVFLSYVFIPALGRFLVPTAMNVAHLALFTASLYAVSGNSKSDASRV